MNITEFFNNYQFNTMSYVGIFLVLFGMFLIVFSIFLIKSGNKNVVSNLETNNESVQLFSSFEPVIEESSDNFVKNDINISNSDVHDNYPVEDTTIFMDPVSDNDVSFDEINNSLSLDEVVLESVDDNYEEPIVEESFNQDMGYTEIDDVNEEVVKKDINVSPLQEVNVNVVYPVKKDFVPSYDMESSEEEEIEVL